MNGKIRSLIAAALLMFVIAGCGGNGGDGGGGATLSSIAVTPANPSIKVGATQQFAATGTYSDGSTQDITASATWSSSDETKATINASGLATAVAAGSSTITATSGSISGNTALTVTSATLASIAVTPANPSIAVGTTQQFTATGTYSDGSTQDITASATWSSSDAAKATINASGLATAVAAGSSTITATSGSISGNTTLTVTAPNAPTVSTGAAINITHNSATLNGTVNPNGSATTAEFQYGATTAYGSNTTVQSLGSGTNVVPVTANLASLTPFTTYNYAISATSSAGTSNGVNQIFNTPVAPPSTAQLLIEEGYTPDVAANADGTKVYAVYEGGIGTSGATGVVFRKSTDSGTSFGARVNISPGANGDAGTFPSIALDSTGNIHVAYLRTSDYHVYYSVSTNDGVSFSAPIKISDAVTDSIRWPKIAVSSSNVYVVWGGDDARIYIDKSPLTSVSFGTDKMVNDPATGSHYGPSIATDSNNTVYVVWHGRYSGTVNQIHLARSTDNAATFSTSIRVDDDTSNSGTIRPRISVSGTNVNVYVVWEDYSNVYPDIRLRVSTDGGAIFPTSSIKVNDVATDTDQDFADIKNDAKGTTYFIWRDGRNSANATPDIYYAYASTNNTQITISPNIKVNSDAGRANYGYRRPAVAIGGGKIFTIWQGQDADDTTWKIYFSR